MARQFLTSIDLNKNELLNARVQNLASPPSGPVDGQIYYDTGTDTLYFYNGVTWVDTGSGGFTQEQIEDFIAAMLIAGTQTGIVVTYTDGTPAINFVVGALNTLPVATGDVNVNSNKIINVSTPTASGDAANKGYVDSVANGLSWKDSVRVATAVAGTLATSFENGDTVDGVTLTTNDRILLKNQSAGEENGIYTVNASGAPTRALDADTAAEIVGAAVFVEEGTANADTAWILTTNAPITLNTTPLVFSQFGAGASYTAGDGLTLTGNDFDVNVDNSSIEISSDALRVKAGGITDAMLNSTFTKKYASDVGDNSTTSIVVTHNLGTQNIVVSVHDNASPYAEVYPEIQKTNTNEITLIFAVAPTSDKYRCTVIG